MTNSAYLRVINGRPKRLQLVVDSSFTQSEVLRSAVMWGVFSTGHAKKVRGNKLICRLCTVPVSTSQAMECLGVKICKDDVHARVCWLCGPSSDFSEMGRATESRWLGCMHAGVAVLGVNSRIIIYYSVRLVDIALNPSSCRTFP